MLGFELCLLEMEVLFLSLDNYCKLCLFTFRLLDELLKLGYFFEVLNFLARNLLVKQVLLLLTANLHHQVV